MPDVFTREKRSAVMRAIRSSGNRETEIKFIEILRHARIKGWRRKFPLVGRPDFCFPKARIAVFVDGCFWHGCPTHGRKPTSNIGYWHTKLARNKARDAEVVLGLQKKGWFAIRVWEHDLARPAKILKRIQTMIDRGSLHSKKS
jgi:DNA mismatch endonuclease (patch repair protein)